MVKGTVTARAVSFESLVKELKRNLNVIDKKSISLGLLELDIQEQSKRTIEEAIQKKVNEDFKEKNVQKETSLETQNTGGLIKEKETNDEEILDKENDLII